eukprot:g41157.t1
MSSWVLAEGLTSEVTCPICLNLYQDPVRLECEHNFCRACIADAWGELESGFSCPQCQETFPQLRLKSNRLLANIVERVRQLRLDAAPIPSADSGPALCPLHEEKLKLYCQDDQQAICVVCGVSKEHKGHRIVPIHETMQYCQVRNSDRVNPHCLTAQDLNGSGAGEFKAVPRLDSIQGPQGEKLTESSGELEKRVEAISRIEASQEKAVLELKFWLPSYRKEIIKLERVRKRFTRMMPGMEGLSYEESLGHFSLKRRRLKDDLTEVYKIVRGIDKM